MNHKLLDNNFMEILELTIALCLRHADVDTSKCYRLDNLYSEKSLFDIYRSSDSNNAFLSAINKHVSSLIALKLDLFSSYIKSTADQASLGGKFLILEPLAVMYDDLAMNFSKGFFDSSNCPPVCCWLDFVLFGDNYNYDEGYLVAWIPAEVESFVNEGIEACPGHSLFFSTDLDTAEEFHGTKAVALCEALNEIAESL